MLAGVIIYHNKPKSEFQLLSSSGVFYAHEKEFQCDPEGIYYGHAFVFKSKGDTINVNWFNGGNFALPKASEIKRDQGNLSVDRPVLTTKIVGPFIAKDPKQKKLEKILTVLEV